MAQEKTKYVKRKTLTGGQRLFRKWADWKEGDIIVGKYVKTYQDPTYDTPNHLVEVIESNFKIDGKKFEGKQFVLNSMGMLNKALEEATKGDVIQVEYTGSDKLAKGKYKGKEAHSCVVDIMGAEGEEYVEKEEEDEDFEIDEEADEDFDLEEDDEDFDLEEEEKPVTKSAAKKRK